MLLIVSCKLAETWIVAGWLLVSDTRTHYILSELS